MTLVSTRSNGWIKIRVFGAHQESAPGQTWSKLLKISEELGFDIKPWKILFGENFDLVWPLVNPRFTKSILVILAEKDTLRALVFERVALRHYICSHNPMKRKWYFFYFLGSGTHIEDGQNTISTMGSDFIQINVMKVKETK